VALGGSTNYQRVHLTPHGNGTHTECYGHISPDPEVTLNRCLRRFLFVARLVSVAPHAQPNGDRVVLLADVQAALAAQPDRSMPEALVLRTLPNDAAKRSRQYSGTNPTYTSPALAHFLVKTTCSTSCWTCPAWTAKKTPASCWPTTRSGATRPSLAAAPPSPSSFSCPTR
jgi:hypothetical protein